MKSLTRHRLRREVVDFTLLCPALLLVGVFVFFPLARGVPISFLKWDGFSTNRTPAGWSNFLRVFTDRTLQSSVLKTLVFALYAVTLTNLLGLLAALLLRRTTRGDGALRTMVFMPHIISLVLSSYIWSYIFSEIVYRYARLPSPLSSPEWVLFGLAIIAVWRDAGYCMLIYYAALHSVPQEIYENSRIEGARPMTEFFRITMPMIMPAFTANITLTLSWALRVFDYPMAATLGGPGNASETANVYIYRNIFIFYKAGYGQASALVFTVFIFILTSIVSRALRKREVEL
jgi:raffinose/stachyose/melibiose transport system permease protein